MTVFMSKKLLGAGDLLVIRSTCNRGIWITPKEMKEVSNLVGEVGYMLYSYLRTYPFKEASEITDIAIGNQIGWIPSKVKRVRLTLEKANIYRIVKYVNTTGSVVKALVGIEQIALYDAGLPHDIINSKAHEKLKTKFRITSTEELLAKVDVLVLEYETNPSEYRK